MGSAMSTTTARCASALVSAAASLLLACGETAYEGETVEQPSTPKAPTTTSTPPSRGSADAGAVIQPERASSPPVPSAGGGGADDTPPAPPPTPNDCATPGPDVYEFFDGTEAWRYAQQANPPPSGFHPAGLAFRSAPESTTKPSAVLYLLKNGNNGDFLVSTVPNEGASIGYAPIAVIGRVFLQQVPGSVPLVRYLKDVTTLRHRVSISGNESGDSTWQEEPARGFVCPR